MDRGISKGTTNWQLYGSKKPNNQAYLIKYHYELEWTTNEKKWEWKKYDIKNFNTKKYLSKLSVQYNKFANLDFNDSIRDKIEEFMDYTISEIFESMGEQRFREMEESYFLEKSQQSGLIISTGGGYTEEQLDFQLYTLGA